MKCALIVIVCVLGSACALNRTDVASAASTGNANQADRVSEASVRAHMAFLAGDALNGRGSGTRDEWIAVSYAAALMQRLGLEAIGDAGGFVQTIPTRNGEGRTWNAVGRLPGADPAMRSSVILLSAHIDHLGNKVPGAGARVPPSSGTGASADTVYNGADDDASGTVAVLELMDALTQGPRPKRTIIFALFGSEEQGGLGSRHFIEAATVPLPQIIANLQFEMIGRPDATVAPRTLWLTGYERSTLGPELARRGARLVRDPHPEMNFFARSDNIRFARQGVVAHTVASYGLHKEYHTPADEIRLIDFAHMTDAIASLVEPIRWLANSDFMPAWNPGMKP